MEWSGSLFHECESFSNGPTEPHIIVNVMKESESFPILVGIPGDWKAKCGIPKDSLD